MSGRKATSKYIIEYAQLMAEWDWGENEKRGLNPHELTQGSGKKPRWVCVKGHKWDATINHRTSRKSGCPYCSNKRILAGYNDLRSQRPDLMKEWDFIANTIDPSAVAVKSNKVAHWICPKGHKYTREIYQRASGGGCVSCSRARGTSFPEQCFYYYTKKLYPDSINGYKDIFEGQMELDIYIPSLKTGVEYDGIFWHDKNNRNNLCREEKKYQICKKNQIRLLRIKEGAFTGFSDTADKTWYIPQKYDEDTLSYYIKEFLKELSFWGRRIPKVDVKADKTEIMEFRTLKLEDSLAYLYPEIAKEWHPAKNGRITPDLFVPGSGEKVWWLCSRCGNEWQAIIVNRVKGHGCDICATERRKISKKETLLSARGSIDKEWCLLDWDYEENEYGPEHYTNGSGKVVSWRCHTCGHKWKTAICDRTRDYRNGCPLCSGKVVVSGVNDLATLRPELMKDWDYKKNEIDPTEVGVGSHLYASWICNKCGYGWDVQIYNRANGKGCPCCANRVIVPGINDLATTDPELAKEWHPMLNTLKPTEVTRGQSKKGYWICSKCGNVWQDTLNHRSRGRGCSKCNKRKR